MKVKFSSVTAESYCHSRTCAHSLGFVIFLSPSLSLVNPTWSLLCDLTYVQNLFSRLNYPRWPSSLGSLMSSMPIIYSVCYFFSRSLMCFLMFLNFPQSDSLLVLLVIVIHSMFLVYLSLHVLGHPRHIPSSTNGLCRYIFLK